MRRAIHIESQFGFDFADALRLAQLAEQTGYHALWASDHLFWDADSTHRNCLEPWTLLTALAPLTTALRLGSHVTCNAFRHPSMLAKTVACLDTISQGRVDCGIGAGWNEAECQAYGIPFPSVGTRMAQLGESVQILKQLWSQDRVTFQGQHYQLDNALCAPKPVQSTLPLWIGGQGEQRLLRLVAQEADGWNMVLGCSVPEVRHKLEVLQRHCDALGRDMAAIDKSLFVFTYLCDTDQAFRQLQADLAQKLGPGSTAMLDRARHLGLGGPAAQVLDTLGEYQALGFDYFIVLFPYTHEPVFLQQYAEAIWPHLVP
ncbi:TIGR03560 family F420-dependent LLM class oxidoreductase [Candidatus Entotheonella palauensis]|uniref:TIGR03560 family F420-dependent LLM class oxidoreductase n=1 Tax=Candidatus Entotheonella palauensis TaxID=93172 RepID=UPI000B7DC033|nr:TIGR03560 family F420-dependent LLM class oxidoreductase [Candidatus Entotheonella palauensis]